MQLRTRKFGSMSRHFLLLGWNVPCHIRTREDKQLCTTTAAAVTPAATHRKKLGAHNAHIPTIFHVYWTTKLLLLLTFLLLVQMILLSVFFALLFGLHCLIPLPPVYFTAHTHTQNALCWVSVKHGTLLMRRLKCDSRARVHTAKVDWLNGIYRCQISQFRW